MDQRVRAQVQAASQQLRSAPWLNRQNGFTGARSLFSSSIPPGSQNATSVDTSDQLSEDETFEDERIKRPRTTIPFEHDESSDLDSADDTLSSKPNLMSTLAHLRQARGHQVVHTVVSPKKTHVIQPSPARPATSLLPDTFLILESSDDDNDSVHSLPSIPKTMARSFQASPEDEYLFSDEGSPPPIF